MLKKLKESFGSIIVMSLFVITGGICGFIMVRLFTSTGNVLYLPFSLIMLIFALVFHIIIHEAGHLILGLLSGYKFTSFRVGSFMWVSIDDKLKFKRFKLVGTGGQCLMEPPEFVGNKFPIVLYNLGGTLANLITSSIFILIYQLLNKKGFMAAFCLILALCGFLSAVVNGLPLKSKMLNNDGYNTLCLKKNSEALRSFWIQLKINSQAVKGIRLKDMPAHWFALPNDEAMKNSISVATAVLACERLMDEHRFNEADKLTEQILESESAIVGLQYYLLICNRIYCEIIADNRSDVLNKMLTKTQKKFMKSMNSYGPVLRTQYAYALLVEKDYTKANLINQQFEKISISSPYLGEVELERELISLSKAKCL